MNNKSKYLFKNTFIFFVSAFATKLLSFFFMPVYTSYLSLSEYGVADLIYTTTTLLVYIFTLNIKDAVLRFVVEKKSDSQGILSYGFRLVLIGGAICGVLIGAVAFLNIFELQRYCFAFLFAYFIATSIYELISFFAKGIDNVKQVGIASVIASAVAISCNIVFIVVLKLGLLGLLLANVLSIVSAIVFLWISLKIPFCTILSGNLCDISTRKRMLRYSIPLIFNGIAWWLNSAFDKYTITYMVGVDQNGLYSVASKIPLIIATMNSIFAQAWSLSAIKDIDAEDEDGFFSNSYSMYNFVLVFMGSILIWVNIPLAGILFAKDFFPAWNFSSILIISTIFNALSSYVGGAFTKAMRTDVYAKTTIISTVVNVVLNILFISLWGALGAAIATTVCFIVMWGIRFILAKRFVRIKVNILKHILSYFILIIQVVIEHLIGRFSLVQIFFLLLLVVIYKNEFKQLLVIAHNFLKKIRKRMGTPSGEVPHEV